MYIILLGAPGAGKGTQAVMLVEEKGLAKVSPGDLFRKAVEQETELGKQAKAYMEKGQLVPDKITIEMILERLAKPDCNGGAILDGFPRNLKQAKALDKALAQQNRAIDKVINIKVTEEEVLKRLSGRWICRNCQAPYHQVSSPPKAAGKCDRCSGELYQRADDNPATIKKRLEVYLKEASPLIDYYKRAGKLVEIISDGGPKAVHQRILAALN